MEVKCYFTYTCNANYIRIDELSMNESNGTVLVISFFNRAAYLIFVDLKYISELEKGCIHTIYLCR
jgi:hypothetical protein